MGRSMASLEATVGDDPAAKLKPLLKFGKDDYGLETVIDRRSIVSRMSTISRIVMRRKSKKEKMRDLCRIVLLNHLSSVIEGIDVMTKLLVADQYNLSDVKDHCLRSFNNASELLKLVQAFPECDNFSSDMKVALFDKLKKLKLQ